MFSIDTKVLIVTDHVAEIEAAIRALAQQQVLVGIPAEKAGRDSEKGGEINNAALGYIHDRGMPTQNIPARPFLEVGIADADIEINAGMERAAGAALDGDISAVTKNLVAVGIVASTSVKMKIQSGPFVPLKPATIRARQRAGFSGTKPLIRTGQLRNAVTFVLRKR